MYHDDKHKIGIDAKKARQQRHQVAPQAATSIPVEESKQNQTKQQLNGYDVSVLVVVNGMRGQHISFLYPATKQFDDETPTHEQLNPSSPMPFKNSNTPHSNPGTPNSSNTPHTPTSINSHHQSQQPSNHVNTQQHMIAQPQKLDSFDFVFDLHSPTLSYLLCPPKNNITDKLMCISIDDLQFISRPSNIPHSNHHHDQATDSDTQFVEGKPRRVIKYSGSANLIPRHQHSFNILTPRANCCEHDSNPHHFHKGDFTDYSIVLAFRRDEISQEKIKVFQQLLNLLMCTYAREEKRCQYVSSQLSILAKIKDTCKDWRSLLRSSYDKSSLVQELVKLVESVRRGQPLQLRVNNWIEIGFKIPKQLSNPHYTYRLSEPCKMDGSEKSDRSLYFVKPYYACIKVKDSPKFKIPPDGLDDVQKVFNLLTPLKTLQDISREYNLTIDFVSSVAQHLVNWGLVRPIPRLTNGTILVLATDELMCMSQHLHKKSFPTIDQLTTFPPNESVIREFAKNFSTMPTLIEMLQVFSTPKTYRQHLDAIVALKNKRTRLPKQDITNNNNGSYVNIHPQMHTLQQPVTFQTEQSAFAQAVLWLLRRDYIKPLRTFIQLAIPSTLPNTQQQQQQQQQQYHHHIHHAHHSLHHHHQILSNAPPLTHYYTKPGNDKSLTSYEMSYLKNICDDKYLMELFKSLYVYFNGEYTEQAIMWHENVSRDDMKRLLDTFKHVLLTYEL